MKVWMRRMAVVVVALGLASCATMPTRRYVGSGGSGAPPRLGIEASGEHLAVSVDHWILPNGPGTWVKDAKWDEVVLSIANVSGEVVAIDAVRLIDPRGLYITPGIDPRELETRSERLAQEYEDIGVSVAIWAAPAAITGAAIATGSLATAVTAAALAPVAVVAAPAYYFWRKHAKAEDQDRISSEFRRRQLSHVTLATGGTARGSRFFPIVPSPRALAVDYRIGREARTLEVPLALLASLHVGESAEGGR